MNLFSDGLSRGEKIERQISPLGSDTHYFDVHENTIAAQDVFWMEEWLAVPISTETFKAKHQQDNSESIINRVISQP